MGKGMCYIGTIAHGVAILCSLYILLSCRCFPGVYKTFKTSVLSTQALGCHLYVSGEWLVLPPTSSYVDYCQTPCGMQYM